MSASLNKYFSPSDTRLTKKLKFEDEISDMTTESEAMLNHSSAKRLIENARASSQCEIVELTFEYTIPDFNLLPQGNGQYLLTPSFFSKSHPDILWNLVIYPRGKDEQSRGFTSLFLERVTKVNNVDVVARYKQTVLRNGKVVVSEWFDPPHHFIRNSLSIGFPKYLSLNQLLSGDNSKVIEVKIIGHLIFEIGRNWITSVARTVEDACSSYQQKVVELNFDCVIEELSFLPQKTGEGFYSPIFFARPNDKIRWRLLIYPKGYKEDSKDYMALFLMRVMDEKDPPVAVKFRIAIWKNGLKVAEQPDKLRTLGNRPLAGNSGLLRFAQLGPLQRDDQQRSAVDEMKISCQLVYAI